MAKCAKMSFFVIIFAKNVSIWILILFSDRDGPWGHFENTGVHVRHVEAKSKISEEKAEKHHIFEKGR